MNRLSQLIGVYNREKRELAEEPMTQRRLARIVGVDPATVSRHVNGHTSIELYQAVEYAKALKCRIEDLVKA